MSRFYASRLQNRALGGSGHHMWHNDISKTFNQDDLSLLIHTGLSLEAGRGASRIHRPRGTPSSPSQAWALGREGGKGPLPDAECFLGATVCVQSGQQTWDPWGTQKCHTNCSSRPWGEGHWVVALRTLLRGGLYQPSRGESPAKELLEVPPALEMSFQCRPSGKPTLLLGSTSSTPRPCPLLLMLRCKGRNSALFLEKERKGNRSPWQADPPALRRERAESALGLVPSLSALWALKWKKITRGSFACHLHWVRWWHRAVGPSGSTQVGWAGYKPGAISMWRVSPKTLHIPSRTHSRPVGSIRWPLKHGQHGDLRPQLGILYPPQNYLINSVQLQSVCS